MLIAVGGDNKSEHTQLLQSMFEERKRVFVDLLKWDIPVLAGKYEIDQFDDEEALYLILLDDEGEHVASARLLRTDRPHLLDTLYPDLCAVSVPKDFSIKEITRFCLSRRLTTRERRHARNRLVTGLAEYALMEGITSYTGIAELSWLQQILAFGWECRPLGIPRRHGSAMLGALRIDIKTNTLDLLRSGGIYSDIDLGRSPISEVA